MKICVLQPDYTTSAVDYQHYDPPRDLARLLPGDEVDHVFLNKLTTYRQLRGLKKKGYDIFVNLCEGYLDWDIPSIDVIQCLELLQLPFTGPASRLYDPPKPLMKYVAFTEGIKTPPFLLVEKTADLARVEQELEFPLFVKPAKAGDSLGIDLQSRVNNPEELALQVSKLLPEYDQLLVEAYISGREFTVMVAANPLPERSCRVLKPVEFIFPAGNDFKTYALKTSELHPEANIPVTDPVLDGQLREAAERIFRAFNGVGYARLDFRMDESGNLYFLEINFTCSVFYTAGYEGSADYILQYDGLGQEGFLRHIIAEGLARAAAARKTYEVKGNAIAGFGIYASRDLDKGALVFAGEEKAQRLVTRRYVESSWNEREKQVFRQYAYPVSDEVFLLWDHEPGEWAPQNHSCAPNTAYDGLNVYTLRPVRTGEELTLDYAAFLSQEMAPFKCQCGAINCQGWIEGKPGNTISSREKRAINEVSQPVSNGRLQVANLFT